MVLHSIRERPPKPGMELLIIDREGKKNVGKLIEPGFKEDSYWEIDSGKSERKPEDVISWAFLP